MTAGGHVTLITLARFIAVPSRIAILFAILLVTPTGHTSRDVSFVKTADTKTSIQPRMLTSGETISDTVSTGETRVYAFNTPGNQNTVVEIVKGDLRLKLLVCTQTQSCVELTPRRFGKLSVPLSAGKPELYKLEVTSMEKEGAARQYELRVVNTGKRDARHRFIDPALRSEAEAEKLRTGTGLQTQLDAASKYDQAARLWESAGEFVKAAQTRCEMGDVYFEVSEYPQAITQYTKARALSERVDRLSQLAALYGIGHAHVVNYENEPALAYAKQMLDLIESADPAERDSPEYRRARAQAESIKGEAQYNPGQLNPAVQTLQSAVSLYTDAGDRSGQALALRLLGYSLSDLGNPHAAKDHYQRSLNISLSIDDRLGIAFAHTAIGGASSSLGEEQVALNLHKQAIEQFRKIGNKEGEAQALNGVGSVYQDSNQYQEAFDTYAEVLKILEAIGNRGVVALNKVTMGKMLYLKGDIDGALRYVREGLELSRELGEKVVESNALKTLGTIDLARGDTKNAIKHFEESLALHRTNGTRRNLAFVLNDLGHVYHAAGDVTKALEFFAEALPIMRRISDRRGEALLLFNTAKAEVTRGNLAAALPLVENAIAISESLRSKIKVSKLRTSFFATVHQQYQLYIDVLMRLHTQQPDKNFHTTALVASERARARSLLDSLFEDRIAPGNSLAHDLLPKEQELLQQLEEKADYQTRLLGREHTEQEANDVAQEIRALTIEYEDVRAKLREQSPRLATITQPDQLRAEDIQAIVKEDDTALLEFFLGDERSYLWLLNANGVVSYELPGRAKIDDLAGKTYELLTARQLTAGQAVYDEEKLKKIDEEYWTHAAALSTMVLGPAVDRLRSKRLLIVADGYLRYIPFEALPMPNSSPSTAGDVGPEPLFLNHEVVGLPSALILAALRSERPASDAPAKTIAVIADPVYEPEDPRVAGVRQQNVSPIAQNGEPHLVKAMRDFDEEDGNASISRLPSTAREAQTIVDMTPAEETMLASGFAATKQRIAKAELKGFRIIHFAAHGLLNNESPELSGVVLSLVDEQGNNRAGFLRLHDIYGMELSADLVVLSACRTGLGRNVQGEGIVGLTSGFMYAGAKSVIASLWKVDDDATAELMGHFYTALLKNGMSPAAALNAAKREMWKQPRWRSPFYWAAFTLQGEYTADLAVSRGRNVRQILMIGGGVVVVVILSTFAFARYRRRARRV